MRTRFPAKTASLLLVIVAAFILAATPDFADPITVRVVGVHDG